MDAQWALLYRQISEKLMSQDELAKVWDRSNELGVRWSWPGMWDYPAGWLRLEEKNGPPPPLFCYKGEPVWTKTPLISVVGSRTPMRETCLWMQRELARFLDENEFAVVSGGARGVDQWAHRICMDSGRPTVCVFPSGLEQIYPPGSEKLFQRIVDTGGAWVSTFALDQEMRKRLFLSRNRWIVGFSPVTFVVEANRRSGSSMTARIAQLENRALCTLPVFPYSNQGLANLDLLVEPKAGLIRDYKDIAGIAEVNRGMFNPAPFVQEAAASAPPDRDDLGPRCLESTESYGEKNNIH